MPNWIIEMRKIDFFQVLFLDFVIENEILSIKESTQVLVKICKSLIP